VPSRCKDEFENAPSLKISADDFTTKTPEGLERFVENLLIGFAVIMEGTFLFRLRCWRHLHRRNQMTGIGEQIQYIPARRNHASHSRHRPGITASKEENPACGEADQKNVLLALFKAAVELRNAYAEDLLWLRGF